MGEKLKEIRPVLNDQEGMNPTGKTCPSCEAPLYWGQVPCPEGKPGGLVIHFGYVCTSCGKCYEG